MSELDASSRDDNITKSVDAYIREHIETGLGQTVYYHYQNVPSSIDMPDTWVVPTLIQLGPIRPAIQGQSDSLLSWSEASIDINIYQRSDPVGLAEVNIYSLVTLATNIKNLFQIRTSIPIYDYNTMGNPMVAGFVIYEEPRRQAVQTPDESAIRQMNILVPLMYHSMVINAYS